MFSNRERYRGGDQTAVLEKRLIEFQPLTKGALCGFAIIEPWASLPSKPQLDKDGRQKIGTNGRAAYVPFLEWRFPGPRRLFPPLRG
jgi:hypothetical protein